ncbi:photosystem I reaction center protein PsaF subunit III [Thalassoporum mexicanum PCC 7367]|uniref:photosystem I reaction center protein PsaF subunit III n=1 Tax=Thalassoporum mexicanum TaxID=3457544 RepID=UPI00029F94A5|nr:photosystem I reaction center protein PsaF subunit III [Pseudanabaena sp. PCC 7367]AFY68690.1 photosystem I reaction center protein PsaF subunit III [Pseudanabaena sp. PCC 7367]
MRRLFALILVFSLCFGLNLSAAPAAWADFANLTPCSDSAAFQENLSNSVAGYEARLDSFDAGSGPYQYLQGKIDATKARYAAYADAGLLCGTDGLPHLISDGRWNRASEFLIPSIMFLYIAGWIGWVGRDYLRKARASGYNNATQKEIIIDVPTALGVMLPGFIWPVAAFTEFASGKLVAPEKEVPISPR